MASRSVRGGRQPAPGPNPPGGLADLVDLLGGESARSRRFLGGLVAGALVGAALVGTAGAAIVRRRGGARGTGSLRVDTRGAGHDATGRG